MFLEICMQIHSVVSRQINKQKVCENKLISLWR